MADRQNRPEKAVVVEFKVLMHCKACERTVIKALTKVKGVEMVSTDMEKHTAVVTGRIEPEKVLKKLKKKTGKRVEIVIGNDNSKAESDSLGDCRNQGSNYRPLMLDGLDESVVFNMFSDENPNACSIM